ncbi:MAG: nuclear transport factor 2 family protein [Gemmatimonadaceae bacterium]|jgi:ketosteroid isomerase-like protein|nr:nuclear transport factor 2 family protein [Gemmatimonadaceae bacterium]
MAGTLLGVAPLLHAQAPRSAEARAAEATVRAVFAAGERGDLAALDTLYAGDSLTIVEGAGINRGWADYRDHHLGPELKEMKNFRYRPFEIEPRVQGDLAWVTFRYALQADMNGRAVDALGRGTMILERRGRGSAARWVVRHSQTASRARRAGDPPMPAGA